jgi:hypothetical protein
MTEMSPRRRMLLQTIADAQLADRPDIDTTPLARLDETSKRASF